jgi:hypothetical protein
MSSSRRSLPHPAARLQARRALEARAARAVLEAALDARAGGQGVAAWPWSRRLSLWLDALLLLEEGSP